MNLTRNQEEVKLELQIAPLIDVVFLLLIYFMVTTSPSTAITITSSPFPQKRILVSS